MFRHIGRICSPAKLVTNSTLPIIVILASLAQMPLAAAQADNRCSNAGRSLVASYAVNLTFKNNTKHSVNVLWINYEGAREFYRRLPPGKQYVQPTYRTHPWVVTDIKGNCLLAVTAKSNRIVSINQ